jgi:integrase
MSEKARGVRSLKLVTEDCFAALIRAFMASPKFQKYKQSTQDRWGLELRFMSRPDILGAKKIEEIRPSLVQAYLDGLAGRPGKAMNARAVLVQLEKWAIVRDLLPRTITTGVEAEKLRGGHAPWTDDQVELGECLARWDLARVITLAANTGQRGSDLVRMGWTDIEVYRGVSGINVTQKKTGREVWVPITSPLASAMETWERRPGPFLVRLDGRSWTRRLLTLAWCDHRAINKDLEPIAKLHIHGLRGTACVRLRRAGATIPQIADMVGMSEPMVARYCRFSIQRENALAAVVHLERTLGERTLEQAKNKGSLSR